MIKKIALCAEKNIDENLWSQIPHQLLDGKTIQFCGKYDHWAISVPTIDVDKYPNETGMYRGAPSSWKTLDSRQGGETDQRGSCVYKLHKQEQIRIHEI